MKTELIEESPSKVKLVMSFETDEFKPELSNTLKKYAAQISLPGFRKGRAPISMIKRKYWDSIRYEVVMSLIGDEFTKQLDEYKIEPTKQAHIDFEAIELNEDTPLKVEIDIERTPKIEVAGYKELSVEEPEMKVSKEEIEKVITDVRERKAVTEPLTRKRAVKQGDVLKVNLYASVKGKRREDLDYKDITMEVGKAVLSKEVDDAVIGMKQGETKPVPFKVPESTKEKELKGADASYELEILEVSEKKLPELTDDFVKTLGDYKTVKEYKDALKKELLDYKKDMAHRDSNIQILDKLNELNEFDVPESLIENEINYIINEQKQYYSRSGMNLGDEFFQSEKYKEGVKPEAKNRAKSSIILKNIARIENIEVSDDDIDEELKRVAKNSGYDFETLKKVMTSKENISGFKAQTLEQKVINYLYENAEKKIKKATKEKGGK